MWADLTGRGDGRGDSTGAADTQQVSGLWRRSPRTPVPVPLRLPGWECVQGLRPPLTQSSVARVRIYSRDTAQCSEGDVQQPVHPESVSYPAGHVGNRTAGSRAARGLGVSCPVALAGQTGVAGCANVVMLERGLEG